MQTKVQHLLRCHKVSGAGKLTNIQKHWHRSRSRVWVKCRSSVSPLKSEDVLAPPCLLKQNFPHSAVTFCDDGTTNLSSFLFLPKHSSHTHIMYICRGKSDKSEPHPCFSGFHINRKMFTDFTPTLRGHICHCAAA